MAKRKASTGLRGRGIASVRPGIKRYKGKQCEAEYFSDGYRTICRDAKGRIVGASRQITRKQMQRNKRRKSGGSMKASCPKTYRSKKVYRTKRGACYVKTQKGARFVKKK